MPTNPFQPTRPDYRDSRDFDRLERLIQKCSPTSPKFAAQQQKITEMQLQHFKTGRWLLGVPPAAGWYPDPSGRYSYRYYEMSPRPQWTARVTNDRETELDDPPVAHAGPSPAAPIPKADSQRPPVATATSSAASASIADEIRKLAALRDEGIITEAEFQAAKARLLG